MRLRIDFNGSGYGPEVTIDPSGMLYDASDSPLKASEFLDLGQISAEYDHKALDETEVAIGQLEELEDEIQTALYDGRPKKAEIEAWRKRIEFIIVGLKQSVEKLGDGQTVGATLEVVP